MDDATQIVKILLRQARIGASPEELDALAAGYPAMRAGVEALYAVAGARYEEPGLVFGARPQAARTDPAGD
ncbi:MAG: hypothetical protein JWQ48_1170 [Conexibacter sp.]|jgi:hypothetical protein|nr:hypothetical protein [Conexibacter sp.]